MLYTLLLLLTCTAHAQFISPVKWKYEVRNAAPNLYDVYLTAHIEAPWHIYSQFLAEGGPIPTQIVFGKNPLLTITGKAKEIGKAVKEHEEVFKMDVTYFPRQVSFVQRVKKAGNIKTNLSGTITYMICKEGECLPVTKQDFNLRIE